MSFLVKYLSMSFPNFLIGYLFLLWFETSSYILGVSPLSLHGLQVFSLILFIFITGSFAEQELFNFDEVQSISFLSYGSQFWC